MCYNINMKLLSPAGNFECLVSAVMNGADEVYLGINQFNARNNVDGFTLETLSEAVDFCHLFSVKVSLAINILFTDEELKEAVKTIVCAYNVGVDSFIIQDLGLAKIINDQYPQIEKHASTQMGIHNLEGVRAIEQYGFKRVVLSRETPIDEIKRIRQNSNVELEYFVHGALCVSFSGNCYLSSYLNDASGNRGRCKQLCRLPYSLIKDGKHVKTGYLLSAKDFDMSKRLLDLKNAGVDVLKIEGRARRPYYVGAVTGEYRALLDGKEADYRRLSLAFNRGFTEGYFNGNGNIISDVQNHVGIEIGTVERVNKGKTFNEVFINSNQQLSPKSTFKVMRGGVEACVFTAYDLKELGKNKYRLTTTQDIKVKDNIRLIIDSVDEEKVKNAKRKREIKLSVLAKVGVPLRITAYADDIMVETFGEVLQSAQKQPLSIGDIKQSFSKSEFFAPSITIEEMDNVFLSKGQLNAVRRDVYDRLKNAIIERYRHQEQLKPFNLGTLKAKKFNDFCIVEDVSENFTAKNVILSPESYSVEQVLRFMDKCAREQKTAYLDLPNFALKEDVALLKDIIKKTGVKTVANNYYALSLGADVVGGGLNVYNTVSANALNKPFFTAESGVGKKIDFPYMTLRHCPLKSHDGSKCNKCAYNEGYTIKMDSGKTLKLKRKKLTTCTFYLVD